MLTCYANCRHRRGNGCGLLDDGRPVTLGSTGQCESKEDPIATSATPPRLCAYPECEGVVNHDDACTICNAGMCEQHRWRKGSYWICMGCLMAHGGDPQEAHA